MSEKKMIKLNQAEEEFFDDVIFETLQLNDYDLQCFVACEELAELIQAISKVERLGNIELSEISKNSFKEFQKYIDEDLTGEIADVYIMLEQLMQIYYIADSQVKAKITEKLQRQAERNKKAEAKNGNNF